MPAEPKSIDKRQHERRKTLLSAKVSTLDSLDDCVVHDLSTGGAEIRTLAAFQVNQKVTLEIPRLGQVEGRVVWSNDKLAGIQFMAPLDKVSLSLLARPNREPQDRPVAAADPRPASPPESAPASPPAPAADGASRAGLESRLLELSRGLSDADLELAVEQIAVLSRHAER